MRKIMALVSVSVLALLLSPRLAHALTRSVFVAPISLFGGTAAGLAVDRHDNLYIAENVNNVGVTPQGPLVSKISPDGTKSVVVPPGVLGNVTALAFDAEGHLYVADGRGNGNGQPPAQNKVWRVAPDATITTFIPSINNPTGLAVDSRGNLSVSSFADTAVYKFSRDGTALGIAAAGFDAQPYGIAIDAQDNLYVAAFGTGGDAFGTKIYKVTPAGEVSVFVDPGVPDPHSLVFDCAGNLWATYYDALKLLRIAPDGTFEMFPGGGAENDAANGIAIDSKGNVYVAVNGGRTTPAPAVLKLSEFPPGAGDPTGCRQAPGSGVAGLSQLQVRVAELEANNAALREEISRVGQQAEALRSELTEMTFALVSGLRRVERDLQTAFHNPAFVIRGPTPLEQYRNLITAILGLEKGRKKGVYENLGGKLGRGGK